MHAEYLDSYTIVAGSRSYKLCVTDDQGGWNPNQN